MFLLASSFACFGVKGASEARMRPPRAPENAIFYCFLQHFYAISCLPASNRFFPCWSLLGAVLTLPGVAFGLKKPPKIDKTRFRKGRRIGTCFSALERRAQGASGLPGGGRGRRSTRCPSFRLAISRGFRLSMYMYIS